MILTSVTLLFSLRHGASVDSDPGNDHRHQGPAAGHQWQLASSVSGGVHRRGQRPDNLREDYHLVRDMHGPHAVQLDLDLPEVAPFPTPSSVGPSYACALGIGTIRDWH